MITRDDRWAPTKLRRAARKARTRERLLAATRALIEQVPADITQVTLEAIAREACVSVGAFYLHFTGVWAMHAEILAVDLAAGVPPLDAVRKYLPKQLQDVLDGRQVDVRLPSTTL
jgi:AcrR family transcriptional regulator